MQVDCTDEFVDWFRQLGDLDQGRVHGYIESFVQLRDGIFEPHGKREPLSRHAPRVFCLFPQRGRQAFVIFCLLTSAHIVVVHGYDPNVYLNRRQQVTLADDLIDRYGPLA